MVNNSSLISRSITLNIFIFLLKYLRGILFCIFAVGIFGVALLVVFDTPIQTMIIKLFSITPGVGLGKNGTFTINNQSVLIFIGFWGLIVNIVSIILKKLHINFQLKIKPLIIIVCLLHLVGLVLLGFRIEPINGLIFMLSVLLLNLISITLYYLIHILERKLITNFDKKPIDY